MEKILYSLGIIVFSTIAMLAVYWRGRAKTEIRVISGYNDPRLFGYETKQAKKKVKRSTILFWICYVLLISIICLREL